MPAKRKRNAPSDKSSGKDFKKLKAKVGKKIPNAASHTKTDFKSARIVLPDQSINEEKGGAVTRRNLNLSDLLSQIQHYNVAIRKQAYVGFRELFISSPEVLKTELGSVISKFPKGFIDEDRSVRDVTLLLLRHVLDKTTKAQLAPFLKLLLSWLKIGLTHMNERVRLDSIRATEAVVAAGVCEWGDAELMAPAVLAVLSEGAKSTTRSQNVGIKLKPAKSKRSPSDRHGAPLRCLEAILATFRGFDGEASAPSDDISNSRASHWNVREPFPGPLNVPLVLQLAARGPAHGPTRSQAVARLLSARLTVCALDTGPADSPASSEIDTSARVFSKAHSAASVGEVGVGAAPARRPDAWLPEFLDKAVPALVQCWVEVGPGGETGCSFGETVPMLGSVLAILNALCRVGQATPYAALIHKHQALLCKHILPYFPFSDPTNPSGGGAAFSAQAHALDLDVCRLFTHMLHLERVAAAASSRPTEDEPATSLWCQPLVDFIAGALGTPLHAHTYLGGDGGPARAEPAPQTTCLTGRAAALGADFLPTLTALLPLLALEQQLALLERFSLFYQALPAMASAKSKALTFLQDALKPPRGFQWIAYPWALAWVRSLPEYLVKLCLFIRDEREGSGTVREPAELGQVGSGAKKALSVVGQLLATLQLCTRFYSGVLQLDGLAGMLLTLLQPDSPALPADPPATDLPTVRVAPFFALPRRLQKSLVELLLGLSEVSGALLRALARVCMAEAPRALPGAQSLGVIVAELVVHCKERMLAGDLLVFMLSLATHNNSSQSLRQCTARSLAGVGPDYWCKDLLSPSMRLRFPSALLSASTPVLLAEMSQALGDIEASELAAGPGSAWQSLLPRMCGLLTCLLVAVQQAQVSARWPALCFADPDTGCLLGARVPAALCLCLAALAQLEDVATANARAPAEPVRAAPPKRGPVRPPGAVQPQSEGKVVDSARVGSDELWKLTAALLSDVPGALANTVQAVDRRMASCVGADASHTHARLCLLFLLRQGVRSTSLNQLLLAPDSERVFTAFSGRVLSVQEPGCGSTHSSQRLRSEIIFLYGEKHNS